MNSNSERELSIGETAAKLNLLRSALSSLPEAAVDRFMLDMLKAHHPELADPINAAHKLLDSVKSEDIDKTETSFSFDEFAEGLHQDNDEDLPIYIELLEDNLTPTEIVLTVLRIAKANAVENALDKVRNFMARIADDLK